MVAVQRSTIVEAPIERVWALLRDFNDHDQWHPAVERSVIEHARKPDQTGAIRNFTLKSGERIREQLLSLSDKDYHFRYAIVDAEIPLENYVAEVSLKPISDGNRTFWQWHSKFTTPPGQEAELATLVAENVYEAGFSAIKNILSSKAPENSIASNATRLDRAVQGSINSRHAIPGCGVHIDQYGSPDILQYRAVTAPPPAPGEVRIQQTAIGVNFIDIYCRTGYFDLVKPPGILGMEAVGTVIDTGHGVSHLHPGQRVGYACAPTGAYSSVRTMRGDLVIPLPDYIDDPSAAAGLLKGISAEFLLHKVHPVQPGETVLIYAPAGGVGSLLCQWASRLGATVIGATSQEDKARKARAAGASHVITPGKESLEAQALALTNGRGVDVIFDAVGRDSFAHSLAALAPGGHLVSYGQASGDIGTWDIGSLASNSVTLSRPNFSHYTDTPEKRATSTERLFKAIREGTIKIEIGAQYALSDAADAHRALEARTTTGSTILIPDEV